MAPFLQLNLNLYELTEFVGKNTTIYSCTPPNAKF